LEYFERKNSAALIFLIYFNFMGLNLNTTADIKSESSESEWIPVILFKHRTVTLKWLSKLFKEIRPTPPRLNSCKSDSQHYPTTLTFNNTKCN